jgi:hypothetical protein
MLHRISSMLCQTRANSGSILSSFSSRLRLEKGLPTQSTARRLINQRVCTQFLSWASHWSSGGKATLCWHQATRLIGPIYSHAIGTFNTWSRGPTHQSLIETGWGYNLGGVGFPHITPRPSQPVVSTFQLKGPPGLQFNQDLPKVPKLKLKNQWPSCGLPTTRPSTVAYIYA